MKPQNYSILIAIVAFVFGLSPLKAQITISDFLLTSKSVSFSINGTFQNEPPFGNRLYFVNPNLSASPGFAYQNSFGRYSNTASFTGSQLLVKTTVFTGPLVTGDPNVGDYFVVYFFNPFVAGEAIDGTLSATWSDGAFNPTAVSSLNVFWGGDPYSGNFPLSEPPFVSGSIFLTTVAVPEPSTYALLLMTGAGAIWWVRGRKRVRAN